MGVKGLWRMITKAAEVESPENKTLAVDISIWIHYFKDMQEKDIVYHISKRIIKLLYHNIRPVFIFDGHPNEMKKRVLAERKKINHEKLINDIINNRQCRKCKKSIRTCRHGGILCDRIRNELDNQIKTNLETRDERWGEDEVSTKSKTINEYTSHNIAMEDYTGGNEDTSPQNITIDEQLIFDIVNSKKLTKRQKLKMLLKMRDKRKEKLEYNNKTPDIFSESQLINIKKRNLISFYIRQLEKTKGSKIQSDCLKEFTFTKNVSLQKEPVVENIVKPEESISTDSNNSLEDIFKEESSEDKVLINQSRLDRLFESSFSNLNTFITNKVVSPLNIENSPIIAKLPVNKREKLKNGFFAVEDQEDCDTSSSMDFNCEVQDFNGLNGKVDYKEKLNCNAATKQLDKFLIFEDNEENLDFSSTQTVIINIIEVFNLPYIIPPGEADSQCGYLSEQCIVDGVITEDNDVLLYGGTVYRNFFKRNKSIEKFSPNRIQEICGFSKKDLIDISYVLGSDYTVGINGIGVKKAVDYIKSAAFQNVDIAQYSKIYLEPSIDMSYRPKFNIIDMKKVIKYFRYKGLDTEKIGELLFYLKTVKK
ncbi:DNA repair protein UVH3 [Nosema granulosis]|uniref:DNA repair protein UVH3 n=1 Tax=Nosema granulosis TaxID=83296 RepID=A0A9P6L0D8_9MICR|nr:DNA repair protein UVH3 [Nosema granulosis]